VTVKRTIYLALILFGIVAMVSAETHECSSNALSAPARKLLEERLPDWKILTASDLSPDDRKLWDENYQDKCPGIIEGNFVVTHSFAVSLIRRDKVSLMQTLVLLEPSRGGYVLHTLGKASKTEVPNIILKFPPGTYKDAEQVRSVRTKFDGIAYIKLEAAGTLYYKTGQGFQSLEISE
jgi:hypothetical protein